MGQVTIYLDEQTEKAARAAAESDGISLSKWIAERIARSSRAEWPLGIRQLAGAWTDLPSAEQLRRSSGKDIRRARF